MADYDVLKRQTRQSNYIEALKSFGSMASQTEKDFEIMRDLFGSGVSDRKYLTHTGFSQLGENSQRANLEKQTETNEDVDTMGGGIIYPIRKPIFINDKHQ